MLSLTLDMVQYDCPYVAVTDDYDVTIRGMQWAYDASVEGFETRVLVSADERGELTDALQTLESHERMDNYRLLSRRDDAALIRNLVEQTSALETIRAKDGYLTGPFEANDGRERWHVGFDRSDEADLALAALDCDNDFTVTSRDALSFEEYFDVLKHVNPAKKVLDATRELTAVERESVERAVRAGYFETPREATVTSLADEFGISTTGVSKNIRRGERKLLDVLVNVFPDIEE